jgi:hypothetical protein
MSTIEERFTNAVAGFLITNVIKPLVTYITENPDFSGKTETEIEASLREIVNVPASITAPIVTAKPHGVAGLAPALVGAGMPAGLGPLNSIAPAAAAKATAKGKKKEHPPQVWMTADAWQGAVASGAKICAAYSTSRCKDENKKDKVCGAAIEETTETNCFAWRCSQCKPDCVSVEKYIKKSNTGPIDPLSVKTGVTVPNLTPNRTVNSNSSPAAPLLPQVPQPTELPPSVSTLGKPASPKIMNAAKPASPAPVINLAVHPGLKAGKHLKANNEDLANIVFDIVDRTKPLINAIGKYPAMADGPVPAHYEQHMEELTAEEQKCVRRYGITYVYTCVKPESPAKELPTLPGGIKLPSLEGLSAIQGIPGF